MPGSHLESRPATAPAASFTMEPAAGCLMAGTKGVFYGAAVLFLVLVTVDLWRAWRSPGWPAVTGTITRSHIESGSEGGDDLHVKFTYVVNGKAYEGTRVRFDPSTPFSERPQARLARLPVGQRVTVSYAWGNPSRSVLEPGIHEPASFVSFYVFIAGWWGLIRWALHRKTRGSPGAASPDLPP